MNNPLITAVITTYKRAPEMVVRAAKSVLGQTYDNLELIVVDDSPATYELRDAVRDSLAAINDNRLSYIRHEVNQGACAARNTGINASKGEYLAFLDDDDEWLPEKLEKQYTKFTQPEIGLVYCGSITVNQTVGTEVEHRCNCISGSVFEKLIIENFIGSTSFPLIKKDCFEKLGGFDIQMQSAQDYEMWLRIAKEYKIDYVDECLVRYYIHEGEQITSNPVRKINGLERLNLLHLEYLKSHIKTHGIRIIKIAPYYAMNRQYLKGLSCIIRGMVKNPMGVKLNFSICKEYIAALIRK